MTDWLAARTVLVVAHPDDETISAGALLGRLGRRAHVVLVTDGAPADPRFAREAGFPSTAAYAAARRREMRAALGLAGLGPRRLHRLGGTDQQTHLQADGLIDRLTDRLRRLHPALVLTHPYEGGHPDHDTAAFIVQHALARLDAASVRAGEFASYHQRDGRFVRAAFLPNGPTQSVLWLDATERRVKSAMIDCYPSQADILRPFPLDAERFRPTPTYDFTRPPTAEVHYESFGWGLTWADWRAAVAGSVGAAADEQQPEPGQRGEGADQQQDDLKGR